MGLREKIAHEMYTVYCIGVGGLSFNGDSLPMAEEFFTNAKTEKQANAWRLSADKAIELLLNGGL